MAREKANLVDPAEEGQEQNTQAEMESEVEALSMEALSLDDFQPVPVTAARQPHPFEGYPQKQIKIGTYRKGRADVDLMVSKTHLVALNPKEYVHQDPSGLNVSSTVGGKETFVNLKTFHNRIVRDQNGRNIIVVFDRDVNLADGKKMSRCAIVRDHTARSQLMYTVNKQTGKVDVDRRYVFADTEQTSRLRRVFEMYHFQQTKSERLSQKFDSEQESTAQ